VTLVGTQPSPSRRRAVFAAALAAVTLLAGCARAESGKGGTPVIPPAHLTVVGGSGSPIDVQVTNALSDVLGFWKQEFPKLADGTAFPPLQGSLYSVDGLAVAQTGHAPAAVAQEDCLAKEPDFVVDNAAYCELDDSVIWDRSPQHLLGVLSNVYGNAVIAMVFAHEIGHAIQARLQTVDDSTPTIYAESQADCAAGAFAAYALAGHAPHFPMTQSVLSEALDGFLLIRDSTPESPDDISHGNGFDRLSAVEDGIENGAAYCYGPKYFASRNFTERGLSDADRAAGQNGNQPLAQVLNPNDPTKDKTAGGLQPDLNRFWTSAGKSIKQTFTPVKFAEAAHPACGTASSASQFGYCPDDNTVYYSSGFASAAYSSMTELSGDDKTGNIVLDHGQAGDFALGEVISVAWGMAAQYQFSKAPVTTREALLAAVCYSGAYAADINIEQSDATHQFILSAPDMDEATSAVLDLVSDEHAFSPRGTSSLDRVKSFVTGYTKGLSGC
jgi:predicted metalloprotease